VSTTGDAAPEAWHRDRRGRAARRHRRPGVEPTRFSISAYRLAGAVGSSAASFEVPGTTSPTGLDGFELLVGVGIQAIAA
jgi:hypothetical protein